jgi:hypothetical protein
MENIMKFYADVKYNCKKGFFRLLLGIATPVCVKRYYICRQSTAGFWREKCHLVTYFSQGLLWSGSDGQFCNFNREYVVSWKKNAD